jgi:sphingosine-1-phosphate phosphatase 1
MYGLVDKLKDPRLVARFQQKFGVRPVQSLCTGEKAHLKDVQTTQSNTGPPIQIDYVIRYPFFYYLFCLGASLGYEIFYGSFFPIWFWNVDGWVGRRLILIWALVMYIGQALKDIIRWKRPQSPPVIVLEPEYAIEYGMPSTHAMAGFSLPVTIFVFTLFRYEVHLSSFAFIHSI